MLQTIPTSTLLLLGIIAGPLWLLVTYAQAFTRTGFDWVRHPASLLSQGDLGWLQVSAFVLAGLLYVAAAFGIRRALAGGTGSTWAPIFFGIFGVGMIVGGVFRADPALGFPPGTAPGVPATLTTSGMIHGIAPMLAFTALTIFFFIIARKFFKEGKSAIAWVSIVVGVGSMVLSNVPSMTADWETGVFNFIPLWFGATAAFLWVSAVLNILRKDPSDSGRPGLEGLS